MYELAGILITILIVLIVLYFLSFDGRSLFDSTGLNVEVNAKILECTLIGQAWGTDVRLARDEGQNKIKLKVEIPLPNAKVKVATRTLWIFAKNNHFFYKGEIVTILYNPKKPAQFKLKYRL